VVHNDDGEYNSGENRSEVLRNWDGSLNWGFRALIKVGYYTTNIVDPARDLSRERIDPLPFQPASMSCKSIDVTFVMENALDPHNVSSRHFTL
jgi:hypothetical protein